MLTRNHALGGRTISRRGAAVLDFTKGDKAVPSVVTFTRADAASCATRKKAPAGGNRGPERLGTGAPALVGTAPAATYNTASGVGTANRVDIANQSFVRFSGLTTNGRYEVNIQNTGSVSLLVRDDGTGPILVTVAAGATYYGAVHLSAGVSALGVASTAGEATFVVNSIREVLDVTNEVVPANQPRFDYDADGNCEGLRLEPSRQNLLPKSDCSSDMIAGGTTPPSVTNGITYLGAACSSARFTSAMTDVGYAGCRMQKTSPGGSASVPLGTVVSVGLDVSLSRALSGNEQLVVYWTGSFALQAISLTALNSADLVGQWGRLEVKNQTVGVGGTLYPVVYKANSIASDITVYVKDAQLEVGAYCTDYIHNAGATLNTRAAESAVISDLSTINWDPTGWSAAIEWSLDDVAAAWYLFDLSSGGESNRALIYSFGGSDLLFVVISGGVQTTKQIGTVTPGRHRVAVSLTPSGLLASLNGGSPVAASGNFDLNALASMLRLGARYNTGLNIRGHIRSFHGYSHAKTPLELKALSAL